MTCRCRATSIPEAAATRGGACVPAYGRWRAAPERVVTPPSGTRPEQAAAVISRELARGRDGSLRPRVTELLELLRAPAVPKHAWCADAEEAVAAASELGGRWR